MNMDRHEDQLHPVCKQCTDLVGDRKTETEYLDSKGISLFKINASI